MKTIIGKISIRRNKYSGDLASIYWRELKEDGEKRQVSFYWGELPTDKLETLLALIAIPKRNERKRICRMVGISTFPKEKLLDSDFLKKELFERFKENQRGKVYFQPSLFQIEQASVIAEKIHVFKAKTLECLKEELRIFNEWRKIGIYFNTLCDSLPGKKMTIDFWQQVKDQFFDPDGRAITLEMLKFAASIARNSQRFTRANRPTTDEVKRLLILLK